MDISITSLEMTGIERKHSLINFILISLQENKMFMFVKDFVILVSSLQFSSISETESVKEHPQLEVAG